MKQTVRKLKPKEMALCSKRLKTLILIYEYQTRHNQGIKFNDLVKLSGEERAMISKSEDSLMDCGLITNKMILTPENNWTKVIYISDHDLQFVKNIILDIINGREPPKIIKSPSALVCPYCGIGILCIADGGFSVYCNNKRCERIWEEQTI